MIEVFHRFAQSLRVIKPRDGGDADGNTDDQPERQENSNKQASHEVSSDTWNQRVADATLILNGFLVSRLLELAPQIADVCIDTAIVWQ